MKIDVHPSIEPPVRRRCRRAAAWSVVGVATALVAPVAAIAAGRSPDLRIAYLDPGTGSLILQALVAALAGAVVAISAYWRKIRSFLVRGSRNSEPSDDAPSDD